jgi:predicted Fe-Mo cluster-binding NifX family protein/ribosomal protein S27AE
MKTAFTYWDNRIAPVFDTARQAHVVEAESGQIVSETQATLSGDLPIQKTLGLVELGIGTLVCGAISRPMFAQITAYGIQVVPFVAGDLQVVIQAWLSGKLEPDAFAMPGCRGRRGRCFGGMHEGYQELGTTHEKGGAKGSGGGQGMGQGGRRSGCPIGSLAAGPTNFCVCPQCGQTEPHDRSIPCGEHKCPKCGAFMARH